MDWGSSRWLRLLAGWWIVGGWGDGLLVGISIG